MEDSCTAGPPSRLRSGPAKETAPRVPDGVRREGQEFLNFLAAALPVFCLLQVFGSTLLGLLQFRLPSRKVFGVLIDRWKA